ncbi:trimeric intracellular cation channel family protein [Flammeovirga kamogawensis]|nr:TRIC cation channel family protein [Flammeovirga kamogawensis]
MIFQDRLEILRVQLLLFDTIGLALFTVIGVQVGLSFDFNYTICIILGVITGAFGGVSRDILVNEIPVIFQKEIYATISIIGGGFYIILVHFECKDGIYQLLPIALIIALRLIVVYKEITLPSIYKENE